MPASLATPFLPVICEDHFGTLVADPYRWLENDVRTDTEVAKWVEDGSGKPITKIIEEYSDVYAFLGHFTGLEAH